MPNQLNFHETHLGSLYKIRVKNEKGLHCWRPCILARSERFELPTPWFVVRFFKPVLPLLQQSVKSTEFSPNIKHAKLRNPLFNRGSDTLNGTLFRCSIPATIKPIDCTILRICSTVSTTKHGLLIGFSSRKRS